MQQAPYQKVREIWKNKPDKSTPIMAEDIMHIEQGIYDNSTDVIKLFNKIEDLESRIEALEPPKIVSWSEGTDAQIARISQALRNGTISADDLGWKVGDERTVQLSAVNSTNFGNHVAQTQTFVILHKGGKLLENGQECSFVVGLKNCLSNGTTLEGYRMNPTSTTEGGWDKCYMRTGCNEDFIKMIPTDLKPAFAKFQNINKNWQDESTTTSVDLFAFANEEEIFGVSDTEETGLFQFDYYKNNRVYYKRSGDGGTLSEYWCRNPVGASSFHTVSSNGGKSSSVARNSEGISPFGCI